MQLLLQVLRYSDRRRNPRSLLPHEATYANRMTRYVIIIAYQLDAW